VPITAREQCGGQDYYHPPLAQPRLVMVRAEGGCGGGEKEGDDLYELVDGDSDEGIKGCSKIRIERGLD
jgi:hypothetical protein